MIPAWAPNAHPLIVHFPIALLCSAVALDSAAWVLRRNQLLRQLATVLYILGTASALAAYVTGRAASGTVWMPGMAHAVLAEHWNWALRTVSFFAVVTVARVVLLRRSRGVPGHALVAAFVLAGFVGLGLLIETGDRGGRLVYQYGVGTIRE
jgi:uncharacterized membrane protein